MALQMTSIPTVTFRKSTAWSLLISEETYIFSCNCLQYKTDKQIIIHIKEFKITHFVGLLKPSRGHVQHPSTEFATPRWWTKTTIPPRISIGHTRSHKGIQLRSKNFGTSS